MYKGLNISVPLADRALELVKGERKAAYSQYIKLYYAQAGNFDCGCDNADLQQYYDDQQISLREE
jgi:hypothetical protein